MRSPAAQRLSRPPPARAKSIGPPLPRRVTAMTVIRTTTNPAATPSDQATIPELNAQE